jgi:nucleotide-binding universal stress UspA family protein
LENSKFRDEAVKEITPKLEAYVEAVKAEGVKVHSVISTDSKSLYMDINILTDFGADLIVIGTKGEKGFVDEMLVGSNTLKIIQEAKSPVLVVKEKPSAYGIKNVVYATQFVETDKHTFDELIYFAHPEGSHLHLVSIVTKSNFKDGKELIAAKNKFVSENNVPKHQYFIYPDVKAADGIANAAEYLSADVIVLPNKGKKGIELWVKGSVTEELLKKTKLPVLTHNLNYHK